MTKFGKSCYWLIITLCALCIWECLSRKVQYDGFKVFRIIPRNKTDLNTLRSLQRSYHERHLNFWKAPSSLNTSVDIMVSPDLQEQIIASFGNDHVQVMMGSVQYEIDRELADHQPPMSAQRLRRSRARFDYNRYHTLQNINNWVSRIAQTYEVATEGSIGLSYQKRQIKYLKISTGKPKISVVIDGGLHPREWISPATVLYLTKYLVEGSKVNGSDAAHLLDMFDFYIIPVVNPDGYAYTWSHDRLWRKTRKPNKKSSCIGTNANRNFATAWGDTSDLRSSSSPCNDEYHGDAPFSEPEVAALRDFVIDLGKANGNPGVALYVDYHSYSQMWLTPYGYTDDKPNNYTQQLEGAKIAAKALQQSHGTKYKAGAIFSTVYPVSGDSIDYTYDVLNITHSYVVEGRPGEDDIFFGFMLPRNQIQESGEENWDALVALCNYVADDLDVDNKVVDVEKNAGTGSGHEDGGGKYTADGNTNIEMNGVGNGNGNNSDIGSKTCKSRKISKRSSGSISDRSNNVFNRLKSLKQKPGSLV